MIRALGLTLLALALLTTEAAAQFSVSAARRSAVWVVTPTGTGSGFLFNRRRGLFVTAQHVVGDRRTVRVVFPEYRRGRLIRDREWYRSRRTRLGLVGRVVRTTKKRDLAMIRVVDPSRIPARARPVRLARSEPRPGNRIHLISSVPTTRQTAFEHISGRIRSVGYRTSISDGISRARREIHSTMDSRSGNSGAGVLSNRGELVGVHVARSRSTDLAIAVSIASVHPVLLPPLGTFRSPR